MSCFRLYQGGHRVVFWDLLYSSYHLFSHLSSFCMPMILNSQKLYLMKGIAIIYNRVSMWSHAWDLSFNETKCVAVQYSLCSPFASYKHTYVINVHPIVTQKRYRDLGILMSKNLSRKLL